GDRLGVRGLPALDLVDDHEPALAEEEAERVARGDGLVARDLARAQVLGRVVADALTQPAHRARDLRTVAAVQEVDGLELARRHDAKHRTRRGAGPRRGLPPPRASGSALPGARRRSARSRRGTTRTSRSAARAAARRAGRSPRAVRARAAA